MRYRNTFINQYLRLEVYTNSKRIYKLINNFLDFGSPSCANPKIRIKFYLNEANLKTPDNDINLFYQSWFDENKNLSLSIGDRTVNVTANPETGIVKGTILNYRESYKECLLDLILTQPLRFILTHYGLFFLHASVVCKNKDCILISGSKDSGKSTLALILARDGFNLLADDDCLVKLVRNQVQLFPFPTKMGLNDRILKIFPEFNEHTLKNYRYGGKRRFSLRSISSNPNNIKGLRCKMIIFPRYKMNRNIYMKGISKEETLEWLLKDDHAIYQKKESRKMFWALYTLVSKAKLFELIYNDDKLSKVSEAISRKWIAN